MHRFKSGSMSESNQTSSLLLNHIKDQQFFSTLSTITLQLARETGVQKNVIEELQKCFSKVKGSSNQHLLTFEKQINHSHQNIKTSTSELYDEFEKNISLKEQINFITRMQQDLIQSRQKQTCVHSLKKYATQKQAQLLPLLNIEAPTKTSRFRNLINRQKRGKVCTSENYFKLNPLDLLKNIYQNKNECYTLMRNFSLLKTVFGHSMDEDPESNCPLYNVLFDQSQKLIISGGQQGAIKIWSKETGLLLSSLKGHQEYINKLEVSKCNKYIISSAGDGIRFFLIKDMTTLGGWKSESIIDIMSVYDEKTGLSKFLFGDKKNLYVLDELKMLAAKQRQMTKDDFLVYKYSHKLAKEAHILNIQVNAAQTYVLLGFEHGDIFLFHYIDLFTIDPIKAETEPLSNTFNLPIKHHLRVHRDQIRELKWHSNNEYFVSGGKEGYCLLWQYKNEKPPTVLKDIQVSKLFNRRKKRAFGCNFICFNCTNTHFVAGFMELVDEDDDDRGNGDVIAYSLEEKEIIFEFSKDMPIKVASVRGMDMHPTYPNITVICQGTGRILILDFLLKTILNTFELRGFHLLHPQFALNPGDCRFSKDGKYFVVSTEFGSISMFGYDLKNFYETCPSQQFFANDFTAFTVNQKMQPIPIQGDLQIDMNRVQRGQIRKIRGSPYEKQLTNNFQQYWKGIEQTSGDKPIEHKNTLMKNDESEDSHNYKEYLQKIKFNLHEAENFNSFYNKNLQEIEATKQALLYDEREKQSKVFKKVIEEKMRKLKGQTVPNAPELTHDGILEQIDAKGKRGGRRLMKMNQERYPNYQDDFEYNSANEQSYNAEQQPEEQQDEKQQDYQISSSSSQIPRNTRRHHRERHNHLRYNIRARPSRNYNYNEDDEEEEVQQKPERTLKRRSPAEDVEQMLKDERFRDYEGNNKGHKKRKRNKMSLDDEYDEDFIKDSAENQSEFVESQYSNHNNRRRRENGHNSSGRTRGRPKRNSVEVNEFQSHSQEEFSRLRKPQRRQSQSFDMGEKIEHDNMRHNLRTRNHHNGSNDKNSSKKQKKNDLGECYRCGVNQAVVSCNMCESACCENCKLKRGKQDSNHKFECLICTYVNFSSTAIVDDKKLTEEYFRLSTRSQQIYVPQIDDQVRFFFQGYQEFLAHNVKSLNNVEPVEDIQDYRLMPHVYNDIYGEVLLQTPLCRVKDIKYFFPYSNSDSLSMIYKRRGSTSEKKHINMLINLELVLNEAKKKQLEKTDFWVFYIPGPVSIDSENQYLLREEVFKYIEEKKILQSLNENDTVEIYGEEYQIIEISPNEDCFPMSIWKQVKVSRSDGKRLRHISKESQKRCNIWNITSLVPQIDYTLTYRPQQYQRKLLQRIKYIREHESEYETFEDFVDFTIYPIYRQQVQTGICLTLIQQRIKNNFYRSMGALQFDLDLMVKNSIAFNGEDSSFTETGVRIRKEILKCVTLPQIELNKFSKVQKVPEKQTREKRNIKKKDMGDSFVVEEQHHASNYGLRSSRNSTSRHVDTVQKRPTRTSKRMIIQSQNQSQSQFKDIQEQISQASQEEQQEIYNRNHRRSANPKSKDNRVQTTSKSKKYDKIIEDYSKEQQVYKNIQSHRNRSTRFADNSNDSNQKNSNVYQTRRSSRLHHD